MKKYLYINIIMVHVSINITPISCFSKQTNSVTNKKKEKIWVEITAEVNNINTYGDRNWRDVSFAIPYFMLD